MTLRIRKTLFRHNAARFILARLVIVCVAAGLMPNFGRDRIAADDVVFCPLQKVWVKKNLAALPEARKPFGQICAPVELKKSFLFESSKNLVSAAIFQLPVEAEKLFFDYAEKGKQAFAEIAVPRRDVPERQLARLAAAEKSAGGNFNKGFRQTAVAAFSFNLISRPPPFQTLIKTNFQFVPELKKISRRIHPRSPPFLLV